MSLQKQSAFVWGVFGSIALLAAYFGILTAVSGWNFARSQFSAFWYFIVSLAIGFGIQTGLYTYLRNAIHRQSASGKMVAVTGTTSTAAMVSCCAHYLTNILPVLGASGFLALIGQYQIEFFWFGLAANLFGIAYIARKVFQLTRHV